MPKRVTTPWGAVTVPDDATDDEIDQLVNEMDAEQGQGSEPVTPEPYSPLSGRLPNWDEVKDAAYRASPLPLLETKNLPSTVGAVVGGTAAGTGVGVPVAMPLAMAAAAGTTKLLGGSNVDAAKNAAWELAGPVAGAALNRGFLQPVGKALIRTGLNAGARSPFQVDEAVETAIRENLSPGRTGWFKATDRINQLNAKVREMVTSLEDRAVDPAIGLSNIQRLRSAMAKGGALQSELDAIDNVLADYGARYRAPMSPIAAHELKADVQGRIAKSYVQDVPAAANEARQKFASGLREGIEAEGQAVGLPQIGPVNERVGRLHQLQDMMPTNPAQSRLQGSDAAAVNMFGPKAAVARMALRPRAQAWVGMRMARTGRMLDPQAWTADPLATPGTRAPAAPVDPYTLDQLDIPAAGAPYKPNALDRLDIPEVPHTADPTVDEMWLRKLAGPDEGPVRGISATEDAVQRGGVRGVAVDDTLEGRRAAGVMMENEKPLTKQAVMEMYQRLQRIRNQMPPMGSHTRGLPD